MTVMTMTDSAATPADQLDAIGLGPFRDLWEVWNPAHDQMVAKEVEHFRDAYAAQLSELVTHFEAGETRRAANEAVDMISISLNFMRRLGYTPTQVVEIVRDRAKRRMAGQTEEILRKYP
jgi:hypothetical protein